MKKLRKSKGFTLVELLVVIAIIGILATVVVINVLAARQSANVARIKSDLVAVGTAYASVIADGGTVAAITTFQNVTLAALTSDLPNWKVGGKQVLSAMPTSPIATRPYQIKILTTGVPNGIALLGQVNTKSTSAVRGTDFVCSHNGRTDLLPDTGADQNLTDIRLACQAF